MTPWNAGPDELPYDEPWPSMDGEDGQDADDGGDDAIMKADDDDGGDDGGLHVL